MGSGSGYSKVGLVLMVGLIALGGCRRAEVGDAPAAVPPVAAEADNAPIAELVVDDGFRSTPINPPRTAQLTTQASGSQINLRSQPTTQSDAQGYGLGGDAITLLHLAEGEGGFSWYYVKFAQSEAEGWVRGDFVDTSQQATVPPADLAPGTAPAVGPGPCNDSNRPEAFFETKSFRIHLCQTAQGLSYVGINKTSNDTLITTDVRENQGTYIAIDGNYQYHINDKSLSVYQINSGSYSQLEGEDVIRHERFLY
ncbi:SH3 domain-containing protein [Nodosilinea sp. E11]|uniref:SH3 domain-containing protein n=1 Tax=Nodosilinea sp. E11 TaxID=3037479 RepID=UPI00293478D2|nr:SH3 domain-containing protein [Nodosilinea sp. E11]WOD40168.1 SH3 domain-containing protein [Nodosilinea sp. E11]